MHPLIHHHPLIVSTRLPGIIDRVLARVERRVLGFCRPTIRSLGMSDRPWGALFWIVVAGLLAVLFVITFIMFEGSMWT